MKVTLSNEEFLERAELIRSRLNSPTEQADNEAIANLLSEQRNRRNAAVIELVRTLAERLSQGEEWVKSLEKEIHAIDLTKPIEDQIEQIQQLVAGIQKTRNLMFESVQKGRNDLLEQKKASKHMQKELQLLLTAIQRNQSQPSSAEEFLGQVSYRAAKAISNHKNRNNV